jgi:hypothetical protein
MCSIPLDVERRLEQRWAARYLGVPQDHVQPQQLTAPDMRKGKARWVEPASSPPAQFLEVHEAPY